MKVSSNVKPKKKKVVGYKTTVKPGAVVQEGKPTEVKMSVEREKVKKTYTPTKVETGDKRYGKVGGGTDKEMNRLISEAQAKKKDVTDFGTTGRTAGKTYKAGTTTVEKTPTKLSTTMKVTPTIRKVDIKKTPVYEKGSTKSAKLKPRDVTMGGSGKGGAPANKTGVGKTKKIRIKKSTTIAKNRNY